MSFDVPVEVTFVAGGVVTSVTIEFSCSVVYHGMPLHQGLPAEHPLTHQTGITCSCMEFADMFFESRLVEEDQIAAFEKLRTFFMHCQQMPL